MKRPAAAAVKRKQQASDKQSQGRLSKLPRSASSEVVQKMMSRGDSFSHGLQGVGTKRKRGNVSSSRRAATSRAESQSRRSRTTKSGTASSSGSPFPGFHRPTTKEVLQFHSAVAKLFGERRPNRGSKKRPILDTVVGTILSQNTTNVNSHRAFQQLKDAFKTWDKVRCAKTASIAKAIACGGLAQTKAKYIKFILDTVYAEKGRVSLEYLKKLSKEEVHEELERFPGIGKKTAAIINLVDVGHPDMAVDTHVFRYAMQLGWVPSEEERASHNRLVAKGGSDAHWPNITRDTCYAHLDATFPEKVKYSMHLILTDTVGGLPVVCGARNMLAFQGSKVLVDGEVLT